MHRMLTSLRRMRAKTAAFATRPRWQTCKLSRGPCEPMIDPTKNTLSFRDGRTSRGFRLSLSFAGLLALLAATGCKKEAAPEPEVTVQAEHPEQGSMAEHFTADAVLSPLAQAAIQPKITAPVRRFYVQRGAHVKEGELLATLENNGSYMAAQAAYDTATKAQVPEDAQKAELDYAQAKANLDLNQSIVNS